MAEMEQSMRIVEQALDAIPAGPVNVDHEGRPIDPAAYVDQGKQGKKQGVVADMDGLDVQPRAEDACALGDVGGR
jgi:NADH:ubiquinone oxidoreductase subunit D